MNYSLFNLDIYSQFVLSELSSTVSKTPQVKITSDIRNLKPSSTIRFHTPFFASNQKEFFLEIPTLARFLIKNGESIFVEALSNDKNIKPFIYEVCFEQILIQRNQIFLPGHVLDHEGLGVGFLGETGFGQNFLKGLLYKNNHCFQSGMGISIDKAGFSAQGLPFIALDSSILYTLRIDKTELQKTRSGIDRYYLPLKLSSTPLIPLKILYFFKTHHGIELNFIPMDNNQKMILILEMLKEKKLTPVPSLLEIKIIFKETTVVAIEVPQKGMRLNLLYEALNKDIQKRVANHGV